LLDLGNHRQTERVMNDRFDLECDRAGIACIEQEQVDRRRCLERVAIPVRVGHRAVGDFERHLNRTALAFARNG